MFNLGHEANNQTQADIVDNALGMISTKLETITNLPKQPTEVKRWVQEVFENSVKLSQDDSLELESPLPLPLPKEISAFTIQTVIRLMTIKSDPQINSLYYLNDTGIALGISSKEMRNLLDQEFNHLRYEFTMQLKEELNADQLYWCALILMKIICADGQIHPAEKIYFDIIEALIKGSDHNLKSLKQSALENSVIPHLALNPQSAQSMLKYVVTIAMCDGEYVGQESQFIKIAAESLGIKATQIDAILQPVASSFMVLESLFPRA